MYCIVNYFYFSHIFIILQWLSMQTTKNRAVWADLVRILAMYFVMIVHSTILPNKLSQQTSFISFILFALSVTCVPIFVMLSGAFLLPKYEQTFIYFKKRILRLIIPWVTWVLLFIIWNVVTGHRSVNSLQEAASAFRYFMTYFWFLPMIFFLYIITPPLRIFYHNARDRDIAFVVLLWFISISLLPYTHNSSAFPLSVDNGFVRQTIVFVGYYLLGGLIVRRSFSNTLFFPISLLFFGIVWTVYCTIHATVHNDFSVVRSFYDFASPGVVSSSFGLFLLFYSKRHYFQRAVSLQSARVIGFLGKTTLGIYIVHYLFVDYARSVFQHPLFDGSVNIWEIFLTANFLFSVSVISIFILMKIPIVRRLGLVA